MQETTQLGSLLVYKSTAINENQGFVVPLFSVTEDNEYRHIVKTEYPADILISRGFEDIDSAYPDNELFILKNHYKDEQKTLDHGAPRYWAKGDEVTSLPTNTMLPVFSHPLPPKETGALPEGTTPPRGTFFLKDEGKLYGPMTRSSSTDGKYILEPLAHPSISLGKDYLGTFEVSEVSDCLVNVCMNKQDYQFIISIKEIATHKPVSLDYMSDDRLVRFFSLKGVGRNTKMIAKKEAEKLQQALIKNESTRQAANDARFDRLKGVLGRYLSESDLGCELVHDFLTKSGAGTKFLNQYVELNQSSLLSDHLEKVKANAEVQEATINSRMTELQKQIDTRQTELDKIQQRVTDEREKSKEEIFKIQAETQEQARKNLEAKQEELAQVVAEEEDRLKQVQTNLEEIAARLSVANQIEKLKAECEYYETHSNKLKAAAKGYEDALKNPEELASKMGEMEVITRVLNGGTAAAETSQNHVPVTFASSQPSTGEEIIETLCSHFEDDGGRIFTIEEMTNLVVSISQSFMTVLSGPPGVGKTSTIVRLADALHLGDVGGRQNFLYVPVGRGWVSGRDILGFYNSLKGVYQHSRTGLYDFLNRPEDSSTEKAPQIILLDEANLSSVEHYWSDFLGMCDAEGRKRPIDTGIPNPEQRFLSVGDHVRFIATINNDATTERLSPRLIDRVPVICIDHFESNQATTNLGTNIKLDGAVEAGKLHEFFLAEDAELSKANQAILGDVIGTLMNRDADLGQSVPISHRKLMAITNYCAVAGDIIGPELAMDFAISQHILPHIEGYGTKFRNRIQKLQPILSKAHPRSAHHVERILAGGNDLTGTYSFF